MYGILLLFLILLILVFRKEYMINTPINKMTLADINKLKIYIEKAVSIGQFYGDFRRMYPYDISPWQYNTLISYRKKGKLTIENIKKTLNNII